MNILRKLTIIDWALCALGAFMFWQVDFGNVMLEDVLYLSAFSLWFVMLVVRLVLQAKREKGQW